MDDDFIDEAWIAAGPPPEEVEKQGCLALALLVTGAGLAGVGGFVFWLV